MILETRPLHCIELKKHSDRMQLRRPAASWSDLLAHPQIANVDMIYEIRLSRRFDRDISVNDITLSDKDSCCCRFHKTLVRIIEDLRVEGDQ